MEVPQGQHVLHPDGRRPTDGVVHRPEERHSGQEDQDQPGLGHQAGTEAARSAAGRDRLIGRHSGRDDEGILRLR